MDIDIATEKIIAARTLIKEVLIECDVPMVEGALDEADLNLHWILWNLGVDVELHPKLEKN